MPFPAFFNVHCNVHCMFTVCSLYVHCMFTQCFHQFLCRPCAHTHGNTTAQHGTKTVGPPPRASPRGPPTGASRGRLPRETPGGGSRGRLAGCPREAIAMMNAIVTMIISRIIMNASIIIIIIVVIIIISIVTIMILVISRSAWDSCRRPSSASSPRGGA